MHFNEAYGSLPTRSNNGGMQTNIAYEHMPRGLQANVAYRSITGLRTDAIYDTITCIQDTVPIDTVQTNQQRIEDI